jgi:hypothetical protein
LFSFLSFFSLSASFLPFFRATKNNKRQIEYFEGKTKKEKRKRDKGYRWEMRIKIMWRMRRRIMLMKR